MGREGWGTARLAALGTMGLLALAACGEEATATPDGGARGGMDAGRAADAGRPPPRDATVRLPDTGPGARDDAAAPTADGGAADAGAGDAGPLTVTRCFEGVFASDASDTSDAFSPDYDRFAPVVGSHCLGTNHQDITGVERVVFLGDSVTVGTPPTPTEDFYRSILAERLAARFGLEAPGLLWKSANPLDGRAGTRESGDFASCAEWGARTDDLMRDDTQVVDCLPEELRDRTTLVVMTVGGNDIANIAEGGTDGRTIDELWAQTMELVQLMRDTVEWITAPGRFPNGVYVVFANMFEFTDGTGDTSSCPAAELAGIGAPWDDPTQLAEMVLWANEQYMDIAVDTGTDMIFMLEHFCGHGHDHDNPDAPCYRGPGTERWFDSTCIHPNPTGHEKIADMFTAVVDE